MDQVTSNDITALIAFYVLATILVACMLQVCRWLILIAITAIKRLVRLVRRVRLFGWKDLL